MSEMENNEMVRIVEEETKKMGFFERIASLFISPVRLMQNIKQHPTYGAPILVLILLSVALAFLVVRFTPIQYEEMGLISLERYQVDYFNTPAMQENLKQAAPITTVISIVTLIVTYSVTAVISALIMLLITKIFRGSAKFSQYFSMYLHLYIIGAIGTVFYYLICIQLGSSLNVMSLAGIFMPMGNITMPLYNALSAISIFSLWEYALTVIGVKEINSFSMVKAVVIVVILAVLSIAFASFIAGMSFYALDMQMNMFAN